MNNRQPDHALPEGALRNAVNVDIDSQGRLSRRGGYAKIAAGIDAHSGWACDLWALFVSGSRLKRLNANNSVSDLMPVRGKVCYHFLNNVVYFSDGVGSYKMTASGAITNWGIQPLLAPALSAAAGTLSKGTYLAAITPIGADLSEHGASPIVSIEIAENGAVKFSLPATPDPQTAFTRIYLSTANGQTLYAVADVAAGVSSYTVTADGQGRELDTVGVTPMPPGSSITSLNGHLYVASGKVVWSTDYLAPDRLRPSTGYMQFNEAVAILASVPSGLWIVTEKTYFYAGSDPSTFSQKLVAEYGAPDGQPYHIPNSNDVVWYSDRGIVRAGEGMLNLQEENVATESGTNAAIMVREMDGIVQAIASVQNPSVSKLASASFIEMEVIRKAA